ncbi:MAG: hypothetical protein U0836_05040 [Pirellulales bacterium]
MTPRDWFGVVVRSVAAIALGYALWLLSVGIAVRVGIIRDTEGDGTGWMGSGFALLLAAAVLLLAAPSIVALGYGLRTDDAPRPRLPEDESAGAANREGAPLDDGR